MFWERQLTLFSHLPDDRVETRRGAHVRFRVELSFEGLEGPADGDAGQEHAPHLLARPVRLLWGIFWHGGEFGEFGAFAMQTGAHVGEKKRQRDGDTGERERGGGGEK